MTLAEPPTPTGFNRRPGHTSPTIDSPNAAAEPAKAVIERVAADERHRRRRERMLVWAGTVGLGAVILLFWQFGLGLLVNPRYVSDPATVVARVGELLAEGELLEHLSVTLAEAGIGFLIGAGAGLVSAFLLTGSRRAYEVFEPFLIGFYSIPKIALAPLFILWFGLGTTPKIIMAALLVYFIVFVNTATGIRGVQPGLLRVCRVFGASKRDLLLKVTLPAATPAVVASIRITFTRAIEGAILSEFVASTHGLGYLVARASRAFDIATVFAGIAVIAVVVMAANGILRVVESRLLPWHGGRIHG